MHNKNAPLKYLTPENLYEQLKNFTKGMSVTRGSFEIVVENCLVEDVEWNHMDQMHRLAIHNTYEKGVRIAAAPNFALSLTQWDRWPFLIPVTDVYVDKGLFYQSLCIAGIIFIHSIITLEQVGDSVKLKDEWYIASHKIFKFIHQWLSKKLYKLNARLQDEDEPVRQGRFLLRKKGYQFKTDSPDYYNSNLIGANTIYPKLNNKSVINLEGITEEPQVKTAGNIDFVVKKNAEGVYLLWPAACPHEGGPLIQGKFCENKVTCPWHGLPFQAVQLSLKNNRALRNGFEYVLTNNQIEIEQSAVAELHTKKMAGCDIGCA